MNVPIKTNGCLAVTPAKAGVQSEKRWIPAYAGMTVRVGSFILLWVLSSLLFACSEGDTAGRSADDDLPIFENDRWETDGDADEQVPDGDASDDDAIDDDEIADEDKGDAADGDLSPDGDEDGSGEETAEIDPEPEQGDADPELDPEPEAEPEPETEPTVVSVLTFNILNPLNPPSLNYDERNRIVADFINEAQPDFAFHQEVAQSAIMVNRAQMLAELTGYYYHWEMTHDIPYVFEEGIAILSKWPIVGFASATLPHEEFGGLTGDMFTRSVLGVTAQAPWGEMNVFCSHMTISLDHIKKADQAVAIVNFIAGYPSPTLGFFGGDLNATPETLAMQVLRGDAEHTGVRGNFIDSWLAVNGSDPGYTSTAQDPTSRIDYIYVVPGSETPVETLSCERVFTEPVGGLWPSDHLGIFCQYAIH
ncbi:MAG: endonuclease/exonuclease/phosphatase family protein [Myxococcales bacterium]|nr:MAG: endonuclease/exonuclease/phosphatase family protein [Myxococcales bacterium]